MNIMLSTIHMSATKLQAESLDDCTQLLQAIHDETKQGNARSEQNQQTLINHTGLMETISRSIEGLVSGQQQSRLLSLIHNALQWNVKIFNSVTQLQQHMYSIPPQVERQQPVLFEDAHGRLTPFHVEFINSYAVFQAVLEARFNNMPGMWKVRNLEYAVRDARSKKILEPSNPWENGFRPGRKFVMSMVFQLPKATTSSCPGCLTEDYEQRENAGSDIQWYDESPLSKSVF
ncbi:hypothetical protein Daus18300_014023 [Diaporthe australafricana]|uniref:Ubiquitin-like domain-containing protein n=1 Tax=Diaporthe australafricana TaxID=127596 RepID=A0ABR3VWV8_9PEZI